MYKVRKKWPTCIHMKLSISNIQASLQICWSLFFPHNITILWVMIGPWLQNCSPTSSGSMRGVSVEKLRGVGSGYLGKGGFIGPWNSCMKKNDNTLLLRLEQMSYKKERKNLVVVLKWLFFYLLVIISLQWILRSWTKLFVLLLQALLSMQCVVGLMVSKANKQ